MRPKPPVTPLVTAQVEKVLGATGNEARSREELQTATGMFDREHFRKTYVEPLVTAGWSCDPQFVSKVMTDARTVA
jgi:hypothetical protein